MSKFVISKLLQMKKALITGITGQDGAYLAKLLLNKGYTVIGTSRDASIATLANLKKLQIHDQVFMETMSLDDFNSVLHVLVKNKPDEIYNLAGQSSVGLSFEQPLATYESNMIGTLNLLEAIRFTNSNIKFYNAGSSECFGNTENTTVDETSRFMPVSPYGVAKSAAFWQVQNYRKAYNLFSVTGILFNHESGLRPERFVTRKIIATACRIYNGSHEKLALGDLSIKRDWGWAPEYVEAMWKMLQYQEPIDFIIATGETNSLQDFVIEVFNQLNLNWEDHIVIDKTLFRPSDLKLGKADPSMAKKLLSWESSVKLKELISILIKEELSA